MKAFLSATYIDLRDHRRAAIEAIQRLGHDAVTMEVFGARPEEPTAACLREIEECRVLIGLYAHRYGYIPPTDSNSITEQEYNHARSRGKPVFSFFISEDHPWPPKYIDGEPERTKLLNFKSRVGTQLVRDTFTTPEDLAYKVAASVGRFDTKERVSRVSSELNQSLDSANLDTSNLVQGRNLADAPENTRSKVKRLLDELRLTVDTLPKPQDDEPLVDPDSLLALAKGLMAQSKWHEAAEKLSEYAKVQPDDWEVNHLRGVAFANARVGFETDLASLRAYNEAIAFIPPEIDPNRKARLFAYRGAMCKRLGRLDEAEADLAIAQRYATHDYEVSDIIYNLAGVFALQGERAKLFDAVRQLAGKRELLSSIRAHLNDYFREYSNDGEFLKLIRAV